MCTGIRIYAENGDVVFARTLEFDTPVPVVLGYFPRNQEFTGETNTGTDGMKWTNRYAFGGNVSVLEGGHLAGADGLNEKKGAHRWLFQSPRLHRVLTRD